MRERLCASPYLYFPRNFTASVQGKGVKEKINTLLLLCEH